MTIKRFIQIMLNRLCPDLFNQIMFFCKNRYICNTKNPLSFNEKVQWRKKYQHDYRYPRLVDKWEVRDYIKSVYPEILVPSYGAFECIDDTIFDNLPDQFIMKPTHGFGKVLICTNKAKFDKKIAIDTVNDWLSYNQYYITGEWQYKELKPRVIVDKLLGENIKDYKFFCFNGKPLAIQVDSDRYTEHKRQIRDINWNRIECNLAYPNDQTELEKPKELDKMLEISCKLSSEFDFVRVDLFLVDGNIYFSELTFTPGNGMDRFKPRSIDYLFGSEWKIIE